MKTQQLLATIGLCLALAATAPAQFSVTGGGSNVPAAPNSDGTWESVMPQVPGSATVNVPEPVFSLESLTLRGFDHMYMGDAMCTLADPNGVEYVIFVRPGYDYNGSTFGNSGIMNTGDYEFVESGAPNDLPADDSYTDIYGGQYNQTFDTGGDVWNDGAVGIKTTPLSEITGPAGLWKVRVYDWYAGADDGYFGNWVLTGNGGGGAGFCYGDGAICPCGNTPGPGQGCANTTGAGATLGATGNPTVGENDSMVLHVVRCPGYVPGLFFQGDRQVGGSVGLIFGDGLRCVGGNIIRLEVGFTDDRGRVDSTVRISDKANLHAGDARSYQFWYRDPGLSPCNTEFNITNGVARTWQ